MLRAGRGKKEKEQEQEEGGWGEERVNKACFIASWCSETNAVILSPDLGTLKNADAQALYPEILI